MSRPLFELGPFVVERYEVPEPHANAAGLIDHSANWVCLSVAVGHRGLAFIYDRDRHTLRQPPPDDLP